MPNRTKQDLANNKAPSEGRRAKKQRETRIKLLEAAHKVMNDNGVDSARIADITDHADIGFGTFYNYFPDKDALARWWGLKPDLLFDRMSKGVGPYALEDVRIAIENGGSQLQENEAEAAWSLAVWIMVGGIHDLISGTRPPESAAFIAHSCMRVLGATHEDATRVTSTDLPKIRSSTIDWSFQLTS